MTQATPTLSYSSGAVAGSCLICRARPTSGKRIYGHPVCKKDYYAFANRRQLAFLVDAILINLPLALVNGAIGYGLARVGLNFVLLTLVTSMTAAGLYCLFILKDGFAGASPGKRLCGVLTLDDQTGRPIGFGQSFKRNSPLLLSAVPFAGVFAGVVIIIVIAIQVAHGYRLGDRFAHTKVIWKKYARLPVFGGTALLCEQCGYDLHGNTSGVCPECGLPVSPANAARLYAIPPNTATTR